MNILRVTNIQLKYDDTGYLTDVVAVVAADFHGKVVWGEASIGRGQVDEMRYLAEEYRRYIEGHPPEAYVGSEEPSSKYPPTRIFK